MCSNHLLVCLWLQCVLVLEQTFVDVEVLLHDNTRLLYARTNSSDLPGVKWPSRVQHMFAIIVLLCTSPSVCKIARVEPSSATTKMHGEPVVFLVIRQM